MAKVPKVQREVALPQDHWDVLQQEATAMGLSMDQALAQAVRIYQRVNVAAREGSPVNLWPTSSAPKMLMPEER